MERTEAQKEAGRKYFEYRKQIYASINRTKGSMQKLSKSKLLKNSELEKLSAVISALEELRIEIKNNGY